MRVKHVGAELLVNRMCKGTIILLKTAVDQRQSQNCVLKLLVFLTSQTCNQFHLWAGVSESGGGANLHIHRTTYNKW